MDSPYKMLGVAYVADIGGDPFDMVIESAYTWTRSGRTCHKEE